MKTTSLFVLLASPFVLENSDFLFHAALDQVNIQNVFIHFYN